MNVLFLTLCDFNTLNESHLYTDLLREFRKNGHRIYMISPVERRKGKKTCMIKEDKTVILKLRIGNTQKTNLLEKGISTVLIEPMFITGIKKYFSDVRFDLVLYSTPPITFCKAVEYVKKRDGARTYLLLKDIFPQNSVDLGMLSKTGARGILYRYFRAKEEKLYAISDRIGCMSQANADYVLKHNSKVAKRHKRSVEETGRSLVEVCPNSIEPVDRSIGGEERLLIRKKYQIPADKTVFIYGGNLGKPQGIGFMLRCLHAQRKNENVFFLIVGNGTEYGKVQRYMERYHPSNIVLHQWLPKEDYDKVVAACDIGMIFLDHRFTIPNFPSRLLSYMQAKLPVLAVTDASTDIGKIIVENQFGWWCESDNVGAVEKRIDEILGADKEQAGEKAYRFLIENYGSRQVYEHIFMERQ